jgi:hypothetical protein
MAGRNTVVATSDQEGMYHIEHWLAWLMALAAIVLGAIGLLRGTGVIGGGNAANPGVAGGAYGTVWDSVIWLLPAISAALLSLALHRNDHHRIRDPEWMGAADESLWKTEHGLAWLTAVGTIVLGVLGILVGFHVFGGGNHQPDGIPWLLASLGGATLTNTLHSVRHRQMTEEDRVVRLVQERAGTSATLPASGVVREPRPEIRS